MMNKKGLSFGRLILYILFITILGFIIYSLVLTYKEIKKKEPATQTTTKIEVGPRMAYNNVYDYSANDYISSSYMNFYFNPDVIYGYGSGSFTDNIAAISVYNTAPGYNDNVATVQNKKWSLNVAPYYISPSSYSDDNVLNVGQIIKDFYNYADDPWKYGNNDQYTYTYFNDSNGQRSFKSACLIFECNIPISLFNASVSGDFFNCDYYVQGNTGNLYYCKMSNGVFTSSQLSNEFISNNSFITKLILPVWQTANSGGLSYYFPNSINNYDYYNLMTSSYHCSISWQVYSQNSSWQEGYNTGYNDGVSASDEALRSLNDSLTEQVNSLTSQVSSLNVRIQQQTNIIDILQNQVNLTDTNFKGLFFTFADIPFKTMHNALGFEVFGMNLWNFFIGVLTALGIIWLIKKIL